MPLLAPGGGLTFKPLTWFNPKPAVAQAIAGGQTGQPGMFNGVPQLAQGWSGGTPAVSSGGDWPSPTGGGGGWAVPSMNDILAGDALYQSYLANLNAQGVASRADLRAARQHAILNYGLLPETGSWGNSLGGTLNEDITAQLLADAAANTSAGLSTTARIDQAHREAQDAIKAGLGATGGFRSGEYAYQLDREGGDYTRSKYDSAEALMQYLTGAQQAYTQAQWAQQQALYQAQQQALANWLATHPFAGYGDPGGSVASAPPLQWSQWNRPPGPPAGMQWILGGGL